MPTMTDAQMFFELCVTRTVDRKAALVGKVTMEQRRDLMRRLIIEYGLAGQIADMPGEEQITFGNWFKAIYGSALVQTIDPRSFLDQSKNDRGTLPFLSAQGAS